MTLLLLLVYILMTWSLTLADQNIVTRVHTSSSSSFLSNNCVDHRVGKMFVCDC